MAWLQLRIQATGADTGALEEALLAAGAASVTFEDGADQPLLEPGPGETPVWDQTRVTGLFAADTDTHLALVLTTAHFGDSLPPSRWEILEDKDWEREWMDTFHPIRCGQRLWICPSWREPPLADAVNLLLDPGLAFGTGTHPTTALCLRWLDGADLTGKTVLDYGCGSGILGIAALLLGADRVVAVDNDPQALTATADNARRNRIPPGALQPCLPEAVPADLRVDITVANILAGPLLELAPALGEMTAAGGRLALSGILAEQAEKVAERYRNWFAMEPPQQEQEWVLLSGHRI